MKVNDIVWVATALLHKEHPAALDFAIDDIIEKAKIIDSTRRMSGYSAAVYQHTVANKSCNPARYRYLYATNKSRRRLFQQGDDFHPDRRDGLTRPESLPPEYAYLLEDYKSKPEKEVVDPILSLRGLGKEIWDEDPDEYVKRLRRNWD